MMENNGFIDGSKLHLKERIIGKKQMRIDNEFNIMEQVYLTTDEDQLKRIVTGITIKPGGQLVYELTQGTDVSDHYGFEISKEKIYQT